MSQEDAPIGEGYAVPTAGHDGMTALHHAAYRNDPEATRAALLRGIPLDARDDGGWTPLHGSIDMAQGWGEPERVASLLLAAGASPNATDNTRRSVLMIACGRGSESIVDQLLRAGADVHARGPRDTTPLHEAVRHDFAAVVRKLPVLGADPNLVDYDRLTAEQIAVREACEESVAMFEAVPLKGTIGPCAGATAASQCFARWAQSSPGSRPSRGASRCCSPPRADSRA